MKQTGTIRIVGSNTPESREWAELLEREIAAFRIPAGIRKKTGIPSLQMIPDTWLILLCAPETKNDPEVLAEIAEFIRTERYDHILTLLVRGTPEESFPEIMLREQLPDGRVVEHEPLAANIVADSRAESKKKLKVEKLRLMAPMLGVSFDELRNRRQRQRMRIVFTVGSVVFLAATVFLAYAVIRMHRIANQNTELSVQYNRVEEARAEARSQQDAASEHLADAVAVLLQGTGKDEQLRVLLCMEFLLEYGQGSELPSILRESVTRMCAAGYAPAGRKAAEETKKETEETNAVPKRISVLLPESGKGKGDIRSFDLRVWSPEYRYAVYNCYDDGAHLTWISFPDHPENGYFLQNEEGQYVQLTGLVVLSDGTFAGAFYFYSGGTHYALCRYDPFRKEYRPLSGDKAEHPIPGDVLSGDWNIPRCAEETGVKEFLAFEGMQVVFGNRNGVMNRDYGGYDVLDRTTMELLGTVEGVSNIREVKDTDLLLMETESGLICYRKDPFERIWSIPDGLYAGDPGKKTVIFPDGTGYLIIQATTEDQDNARKVFDLWTGAFLFDIDALGMEYEIDLSADKKLLCSVGGVPTVWELESGEICGEVPDVKGRGTFWGAVDPETGLRGSEIIAVGSYLYAYRASAIPVPESLEELAALAEELIDGRELTKDEREKYHLVH